ncbi:protein VCF1-like isoform X1 [Dipodomys merriami]|uniref:protein VCF1-like isoform X1 n=1 Tax=Dipodomys merriami TaxID=94247 RepID=UPI003855D9B7
METLDQIRKRKRNSNTEDNHYALYLKRSKQSPDFPDAQDEEYSYTDNERNSSTVNNPEASRAPESSLNKITVDLNSNLPPSFHEEYAFCQGPYIYINQILKEAHFYSLQQRGQYPS